MVNNYFAYLVLCFLGPVKHLVILLADRGEPILSPAKIADTWHHEYLIWLADRGNQRKSQSVAPGGPGDFRQVRRGLLWERKRSTDFTNKFHLTFIL